MNDNNDDLDPYLQLNYQVRLLIFINLTVTSTSFHHFIFNIKTLQRFLLEQFQSLWVKMKHFKVSKYSYNLNFNFVSNRLNLGIFNNNKNDQTKCS